MAGGAFYNQIEGLGRKMPLTGLAVVIGGLSLIGVPGTAGFVSKWYLVQAAFERSAENGLFLAIAAAILLSSLLAVVYVWRVVEVLYLRQPNPKNTVVEAPYMMLIPMWILAVACIYFGFDTSLTVGTATQAAEGLLSGSMGMFEGGR